ncbi:CU044_5270 family protein [Phytohabitans rumicis]|uniref:CU044_5270 family protein n=1 Tax=Phytohabitans rumicis TaxID=1076125 RepID=UPI001566C399|nr:CU044_5270 family protein [Phytohabitans rumicis]
MTRPALAGRRLVLAAAVLAVAAGVTAGAVALTADGPAPPGQAGEPPRGDLLLGPVVQPVAVQYALDPPSAGDGLRRLADGISAAPYDGKSGRYTYIHTVGWNAVIDAEPGGDSQVIYPQDKQRWYLADGSGRITVTPLAPVYPNERSRQYWQRHEADPTPGVQHDDLPAGKAGPRQPLSTGADRLAKRLSMGADPQSVFLAVRDVYSYYAVPQEARARILHILADVPGVSWRGTVTDRAGRPGQAVSVDTATTRELLIFDPETGALLAWEQVERPTETVAGATVIVGYDRTDRLG